MEQRECPKQVLALLTAWWRAFWFWNVVHYTLGLTATIGTVIIASDSSFAYKNNLSLPHQSLGILVAICTAIITFSKASNKANAYIRAWRVVNTARIVYEVDLNSSDKDLLNAVKNGEEMIGKAD